MSVRYETQPRSTLRAMLPKTASAQPPAAPCTGTVYARSTPASRTTCAVVTSVLLAAVKTPAFLALLEQLPSAAHIARALRHTVTHFLHLHGGLVGVTWVAGTAQQAPPGRGFNKCKSFWVPVDDVRPAAKPCASCLVFAESLLSLLAACSAYVLK